MYEVNGDGTLILDLRWTLRIFCLLVACYAFLFAEWQRCIAAISRKRRLDQTSSQGEALLDELERKIFLLDDPLNIHHPRPPTRVFAAAHNAWTTSRRSMVRTLRAVEKRVSLPRWGRRRTDCSKLALAELRRHLPEKVSFGNEAALLSGIVKAFCTLQDCGQVGQDSLKGALSHLAILLKSMRSDLNGGQMGDALFSLQVCTEDSEELIELMRELARKMRESPFPLAGANLCRALYGLEHCAVPSTGRSELLDAVRSKMFECYHVLSAAEMCQSLRTLQRCGVSLVACEALLRVVSIKSVTDSEDPSVYDSKGDSDQRMPKVKGIAPVPRTPSKSMSVRSCA